MNRSHKYILQQQYEGFLNTEVLFKNTFDGVDFFELNKAKIMSGQLPEDFEMPQNIRLGQRMEYFMEVALKRSSYEILAKNLQIIHEKTTIGELDFIVKNPVDTTLFHLEMVYKFYLFDPAVEGDWTAQWIGGNRRDSLNLKLQKLKNKQLPLLFAPETAQYLAQLELKSTEINQKICFLGQLFLPYGQKLPIDQNINSAAIKGFWLNITQLESISVTVNSLLIPPKNDWVTVPAIDDLNWKSYKEQIPLFESFTEKKQSSLFWIIDQDGKLHRFFFVWWS
ncbi:DUF1853 family protein [Flavimarina sp. Hel_I_48]|uniref:DUF1853 family protein n=1 Tax=Flavimarina sp. Hel_I_48 TaxID=1392488 RepID=UPI0004DF7806|nr:DUF1853 family protein [Flavimarina sp. Hel_I_48]